MPSLVCNKCSKKVKVSTAYHLPDPYYCAICRGNPIPKRIPERKQNVEKVHLPPNYF